MANVLPLDLKHGDRIKTSDGQSHAVDCVGQPVDKAIVFIYLDCCPKLVVGVRDLIELT